MVGVSAPQLCQGSASAHLEVQPDKGVSQLRGHVELSMQSAS